MIKAYHELSAKHPVKVDNVDETIIKELSYQAMGRVCPIDGFIGGLAAQEAMKVRSDDCLIKKFVRFHYFSLIMIPGSLKNFHSTPSMALL